MRPVESVRRLLVFGAGGHGREVAWLAREVFPEIALEYVVDDGFFDAPVVAGTAVHPLSEIQVDAQTAFVAAVGDPSLRRRAASALVQRGARPLALVHPRAVVAPSAVVGPGAVICANSIVSDDVVVSAHAVVNFGATISHDVSVGEFATVGPGAHIAGHVRIGDDVAIGVGAAVINGTSDRPISIGPGSTVGAGAVVIRDVSDGDTVVGVPAKSTYRTRRS